LNCDLKSIFGELAKQVPTATTGNERFLFSPQNLPVPDSELQTDQLVIKKHRHFYGISLSDKLEANFPVDNISVQAQKETYKNLGLLILSVLFHPEPQQVHLNLLHPDSEIKHLVVKFEYPKIEEISGYYSQPFGFGYVPMETSRHPWIHRELSPYELPCFYLANWDGPKYSEEEDLKNRDTLIGFGNDKASVLLAELLLDASTPQNPVVEYELEGELGFRGVGKHSAEVQLWLPGSIGWDDVL